MAKLWKLMETMSVDILIDNPFWMFSACACVCVCVQIWLWAPKCPHYSKMWNLVTLTSFLAQVLYMFY